MGSACAGLYHKSGALVLDIHQCWVFRAHRRTLRYPVIAHSDSAKQHGLRQFEEGKLASLAQCTQILHTEVSVQRSGKHKTGAQERGNAAGFSL